MPCEFNSSNVGITLNNFIPIYPTGSDAGIVHINMVGVENPNSYSSRNNTTHRTIGTFVLDGESVPKDYPPAAMTANTTNITGQAYGNGTYVARTSSIHGSQDPNRAFDSNLNPFNSWNSVFGTYASGTGVYSSSNTTWVDGSNVSGEWLDLETPQGLVVRRYMVRAWPTVGQGNLRSPNIFTLAGSTNGSNYTRIDTRSNVDYVDTAGWSNTFTIPSNSNRYTRHRIITHRVGNTGANAFRDGCQINELVYTGLVAPQTNSTLTTQTIDPTSPVNAFDYNSNTLVRTGNQYDQSTRAYQGTTFSTIDGSNMTGDWVQLQTAEPIILQNYTLVGDGNSNAVPNTFTLAASSNGTTYTRIHTQSNINWSAPWSFTFSNSNVPTSNSYNYYRVITHTIGDGGGSGRSGIAEMRLTGYSNVGAVGNLGEWFNIPPVAMTGDTTNITGQSAGNGTYQISASVSAITYEMFDKAGSTYTSGDLFTSNTGWYNGSTTTPVLISNTTSNMSGEWIQINTPCPVVVAQLDLTAAAPTTECPNTFSLVARNTGGAFTHIFTQSNIDNWASGGSWTRSLVASGGALPQSRNQAAFPTNYYQNWRLIIHRVGNAGQTSGRLRFNLSEMNLRGYASNVMYDAPPSGMTAATTTFSNAFVGNGAYTATSSPNIVSTTDRTVLTRLGQSNLNAEVVSTDRRLFDRPITLHLTSPTGLNLSSLCNWSAELSIRELD
jgi:hypothetical protein